MDKIRLGSTGIMATRMGFGGIPIQRATEEDAVATVRRALELGINYIDTAYAYTTSEGRIGKAIAGRRKDFFIATKTSPNAAEIKGHLEHSLKELGVDALDLYQLHAVSDFKTLEGILARNGALSVLEEAKRKGQIKHIGISSHQMDVAKEAVKSGRFETIMYALNFVLTEAAEELLPLARQKGVGFIAMKPYAGGRLVSSIALSIKYLLQFPDVLILPGLGTVGEVEQAVRVLESPKLTPADEREMKRLREKYDTRFCRHCDACLPCPQGIAVSHVMDFEPLSMAFTPEHFYNGPMGGAMAEAAKCDRCGECEKKCPYDIPIADMMIEYANRFAEGKKKLAQKK